MNSPVTVVAISENAKIGICSATYVSQHTCPSDCPFRRNGCYAELGHSGIITSRLNKAREKTPIRIAKLEAGKIRELASNGPRLDLRVHVVGDCPDARSAEIVGQAMAEYSKRTHRRAWTYTHSWRKIPLKKWGGANVLASCETTKDVKKAIRKGYPTAVVVPKFEKPTAYVQDGVKLIPCPAQTRGITCVQCRLCLNAEKLANVGATIAFEAHGSRMNMVKRIVEEKNNG